MLPLLGAGVTLGLSLVPRARPYIRYVGLTAAALTAGLVLTFRWVESALLVPSLWQPSLLFGAVLTLEADVAVQPLALALALVTSSTTLVQLGRGGEVSSPRLSATLLTLLAAGFFALWAANALTMIISWAIYDALRTIGYVAAGGSARTAIRSLVCGGLATLFLWGGALFLKGGAGSELWSLMTLSGVPLTLWTVAGILRLWVYPFHLSIPDDLGAAPSLTAPLLMCPVVGWGLWLRLVQANGGSMPNTTGLLIIAGATLALGGFLAWSSRSPRRSLPWLGMASTGTVLLAARLAGESAVVVVVAGGVAWALGVALLSLSDGLQREAPWWSLPALVGALALAGTPLTLGFVTGGTLTGGLSRGGLVGWGITFFVGCLFLVPSLGRYLLLSPSHPLPARHWLLAARGVGLGLPAFVLIVAGLHPPTLIGAVQAPSLGVLLKMPGLTGWLLWLAALAGGGVLAWQEGNLRPRIRLLLSAAYDLLRLEWLYDALLGAVDRGLSALRVADEVVGGAGALLWSLLLVLLIFLVWGQ